MNTDNTSESNSNSTAKAKKQKQELLGMIKIYRRFYNPTGPLYHALKFAENHQDSLGDVASAVLEPFRHCYAPLGIHEVGSPDEVIQSTVLAIGFLEGHLERLRHLKAVYESEQNSQSISKDSSQSQFVPSNPSQSNGHSSGLSSSQLKAMEMYQMFDDD